MSCGSCLRSFAGKKLGGWHLRLGIGRDPFNPSKARRHVDFWSTRVSNSDAKGPLQVIRDLRGL